MATLDSAAYEAQHVHAVYDTIAPHFSQTRYKPWPIVSAFLSALPPGAVGLDAGCGNGKYLKENPWIYIAGSDRSVSLLHLAREATQSNKASRNQESTNGFTGTTLSLSAAHSSDLLVADSLSLPHPSAAFDFAISIAVIHHLSTCERRIAAIAELLRCLRPWEASLLDTELVGDGERGSTKERREAGYEESAVDKVAKERREGDSGGKALIFVWALEQKGSRRGWDEGGEQDVMVPWVMQNERKKPPRSENDRKKSGDDKRALNQSDHALKVPRVAKETFLSSEDCQSSTHPACQAQAPPNPRPPSSAQTTYHRYYHLYARGELAADIRAAGGAVLHSGYEKDNWWAVAVRQEG